MTLPELLTHPDLDRLLDLELEVVPHPDLDAALVLILDAGVPVAVWAVPGGLVSAEVPEA